MANQERNSDMAMEAMRQTAELMMGKLDPESDIGVVAGAFATMFTIAATAIVVAIEEAVTPPVRLEDMDS